MRVIEKPCISGEEWLLIKCDHCEQQFLLAPNEANANGSIKCEFCPHICRKEDIKDETKVIMNTPRYSPSNIEITGEEQK